jgi:hypothetical protein
MKKQSKLTDKQRQSMSLSEIEAHAQEHEQCTKPHYHKDENGFLIQCYHACSKGMLGIKQTLLSPAFWIGITVSYPFEHYLYENVWPFNLVQAWMHH